MNDAFRALFYNQALYRKRVYKKIFFMRVFLFCVLLAQCTIQGPPPQVIVLHPHEILVARGDTIYSLGKKHGVPVKKLVECNGLAPPYTLFENQKLVLPSLKEESLDTGPQPVGSEPNEAKWHDIDDNIAETVPLPQAVPAKTVNPRLREEAQKEVQKKVVPASEKKKLDKKAVFDYPVDGRVLSGFGQLYREQKKPGMFFDVKDKTRVRSFSNGKVMFVGELDNKKIVVLEHEKGLLSVYGPMEAIQVKKDQEVQMGAFLGKASEGEFYFEVRKDRKPVDPMLYLKQ